MKRKHIYIGGTVLLTILGGIGGYFLFSGGDEGGGARTAEGPDAEGGADETQAINVPPVADDAFQDVPPIEDASGRYAMGGSPLGNPGGYSTPLPRGAAPLPVETGQSERPSVSGLPAGEPGNPADAYSPQDAYSREPLDVGGPAAMPGRMPLQQSGQDDDLITRGQEPASTGSAEGDLENSLRGSARAAFDVGADGTQASPSADNGAAALPIDDARYGAGGEPPASPELAGNYDAAPAIPVMELPGQDPAGGAAPQGPQELLPPGDIPNAAEPIASAPAPMTIADDSAVPLSPSAMAVEGEPIPITAADRDDESGFARAEMGAGSGAFGFSPPESSDPVAGASSEAYGVPSQPNASGTEPQQLAGSYGAANSLGAISSVSNTPGGGLAVVGSEGTGRPGEPALEGPQSPQVSVEKLAESEIQVGKECMFSVVVRNVGSVAARDVRLIDEIPLGTQLVGTSPRATVLGSQLEWELGTLAPGDEVKVDIKLLPVNEGEIGSVAHVQLAAAATARVQCTRPVLELVADVPPSVLIGGQQIVRITLRNPGSGDATGVMLLENVPEGMSHPHGRDLEFEVGTLRAGESRELELVLTAERKGIVQNRIVAKGDGNLYTETIAEFEVVAPEIAVSVDGPTRKYLELPATFTVAVENPGTAAASDIELVGTLPEGLEFVSADKYGQYDETTRSVYWSLAELPPRERGEVKLVAMPIKLGEQRIEVKADARLGLADRAEAKLQVEGLAALKSEVTDISDPVEVGGETSYEIRVVNQGSKAATNVQVVAQFPAGVGAIRADGPTPNPRVEPLQVTFAPLERLSPKADATYRIDARGLAPGDQRILVMIMTDDLAAPIKEEESTRVYADR